MKIDFSFHRVYNLARWDMYTNGRFYLRQAFLIFACMLVVPLATIFLGFSYGTIAADFTAGLFLQMHHVMLVVVMGHVFHNLRTRQSRIALLTLPVNSLERFVFHVVFALFSFHVAFLLSLLGTDVLLQFLSLFLVEQGPVSSVTLSFFSEIAGIRDVDYVRFVQHEGFQYTFVFHVLCFYSSFTLMNAWRYRGNIVRTLFLWVFIYILLASVLIQLPRLPQWVGMVSGPLLFVCIWALSYRLYKRAEYITSRNP